MLPSSQTTNSSFHSLSSVSEQDGTKRCDSEKWGSFIRALSYEASHKLFFLSVLFFLFFFKSQTCIHSFVWSDAAATVLQQLLIAQWHFCCGCALDQLYFSLERGVGGMFIYLWVGKCSRQHILFQDSCTVHLQIPGSPIKTYPLPQGTAWQALLTRQHWQLFGSFWSGSNLVWVCYTFILSTSSKQIIESRIPSCVLQWKCFNVWELLLLQGRYRELLTV